jgi:hypothetical protein
MEQSTQAMRVALRVLEAITARRDPEEPDIEELRHLAPLSADMPLDELACAVVRHAIERLEEKRRCQRQQTDFKFSATQG